MVVLNMKEEKFMFDKYPDMLTVEQVCEMLHIGKNRCYDLVRQSKIKHINNGIRYVIPKKCVIEYIDSQLI